MLVWYIFGIQYSAAAGRQGEGIPGCSGLLLSKGPWLSDYRVSVSQCSFNPGGCLELVAECVLSALQAEYVDADSLESRDEHIHYTAYKYFDGVYITCSFLNWN